MSYPSDQEPLPLHPSSTMPNDPYDYFALAGSDRLSVLNKAITEREEKLFELELAELSLEDNPAQRQTMSHEDFAAFVENSKKDAEKAERKFVQQQTCPCIPCQLEQVRDSKKGLMYSLYKLRALASSLSGQSKAKIGT